MASDRKIKVLEISSYPPPRAGWGVRVQFVKKALEAQGHECKVLNIGKSRKMKSTEFVGAASGWDYTKKVFGFCRSGYLIHMHMNGQSPKGLVLALIAAVAGMLLGRRCLLTFHAGADQKFFPREKNGLIAPVFSMLFRMAQRIICNDGVVKSKIVDYGIGETKVHDIPAFSRQYLEVRSETLPPGLDAFFEKHDPILASYLLLRPTFNIDTLFHAIKELTSTFPNLGLVVMGSNTTSDDMDPSDVKRLEARLQLESHIFWAGDLPHDQFITILSKTKMYVRTYIYDGVSSSVLEALALKVPVVACENPHRPPGVLQFKNGDLKDLTEKIRSALEHYETFQAEIVVPQIKDTVKDEVDLLIAAYAS
ncbi:MAG: glycosyltransferase family 4 protein [Nitrospiria bacterium]